MTGAILIRFKVIVGPIERVCVSQVGWWVVSLWYRRSSHNSAVSPSPKCYRCDVSITVYIYNYTLVPALLCLDNNGHPHQQLLNNKLREERQRRGTRKHSCQRILFSFHRDKNVTIYSPSPSYLKTRGPEGILRKCQPQEADVPWLEFYIFHFNFSCLKLIKVNPGASSRRPKYWNEVEEKKTYWDNKSRCTQHLTWAQNINNICVKYFSECHIFLRIPMHGFQRTFTLAPRLFTLSKSEKRIITVSILWCFGF